MTIRRASDGTPARPQGVRCPIPGCDHVYPRGILGWANHASTYKNHPKWHPETRDPLARRSFFIEEFPEFFENARTETHQAPPGQRKTTYTSKDLNLLRTSAPPGLGGSIGPSTHPDLPAARVIAAIAAAPSPRPTPPNGAVPARSSAEVLQESPRWKFCPHCGLPLP